MERPLLVGWSYGPLLAVHWASRNPRRAAGVVSVDGAYPWGLTGEENREFIRRTFHRMRFALPLGPVLAAHPNVQVSAKVASNHEKVLRNDFGAVADAVREITATATTSHRPGPA